MTANPQNEHSKRSLALNTELDRSTVTSRLKGVVPVGSASKARYTLVQVIRAFAGDFGGSDDEISYADQHKIALTRIAETDLRIKDLKLAVLAGDYVHKADAVAMVHKITQPVDRFLLTLADQLEFECGLPGAAIERVNKWVKAQRAQLLEQVSA